MTSTPADFQRRTVLQMAAGIAASQMLSVPAKAAATKPAPTAKPGDFDFLAGEWKIRNKRLIQGAWTTFDGESTVHRIWGGAGSIEELRIPVGSYLGMGLRLLDVEQKLWGDYWVSAKSGVVVPPAALGSFVNGVGTWDSDDTDGDKPIIVRGVWDQITPTSCRWYQATSHNDGKTFEDNWVMHWTRA